MKNSAGYYFFLPLILIILFSSCTYLEPIHTFWDSPLVGSWRFKDEGMGPLVLSFHRDGTFIVDYNADGQRDIRGRYELFENRVTFIDDRPRVTTECYEQGFHYFFIEEETIQFTELAEQCKPRRAVLKQRMVRVKMK